MNTFIFTPLISTPCKGDGWKKLQSLLAQLRKAANHPYLFPDAETDPDGEVGDEIVTASGMQFSLLIIET